MAEFGIAEYFGFGEALGIIGAMFVLLYFSGKQMQSLSADIESKVLNDLDEKLQNMAEMLVNRQAHSVGLDWTAKIYELITLEK